MSGVTLFLSILAETRQRSKFMPVIWLTGGRNLTSRFTTAGQTHHSV